MFLLVRLPYCQHRFSHLASTSAMSAACCRVLRALLQCSGSAAAVDAAPWLAGCVLYLRVLHLSLHNALWPEDASTSFPPLRPAYSDSH